MLAVLGLVQLLRDLPLWYDELYTAELAALPLGQLAELVSGGRGPDGPLAAVPPSYNAPYYALVHLWLRLPLVEPTALWLRLPSLVCAVAAVAVLVDVVRALAGRRTALLAGLLLATAPLLVEQSVEARSYGPALLAVALAAHALQRRRLLAYGLAALAAGLLHWFALPAVAGLALAALLQQRRAALPVLAVTAVAALPTLALVALALTHETAGSPRPPDAGALVPLLALRDWALGQWPLVVLTTAAAALGLVRSPQRLLPACWLLVPVAAMTGLALARPVYFPRYLLPGLVALPVLAALGVALLQDRRVRAGAALLLVAASVAAVVPRLLVAPKEQGPAVVALLADRQRPGEAVVAADPRAALALRHYAGLEAPRLLADLRVPPDDVPPGASAPVWLVRFAAGAAPPRTDDDALLEARGWSVSEQVALSGRTGDLVVQRWGPAARGAGGAGPARTAGRGSAPAPPPSR